MHTTLPIVDLAQSKQTCARALDQAFCHIGFCYITNTGVDGSLVNDMFDGSHAFHGLPESAKHAIAINAYHRGYIAPRSSVIRNSSVAAVKKPNLSSSLMVMHEVAPSDPRYGQPLQGPNQWPHELPRLAAVVRRYETAMRRLAEHVTTLVALALGLPEHFFDGYFAQPTTWLRLLHYPPQPIDASCDEYGAAPHTDYGFLTILAQDDQGGLQVRTREDRWIDAPPIADTFILNVADMLTRWTNNRWTSTPHRVRNTTTSARYSLPYFWDPAMESVIECVPTCTDTHNPPRFAPVRFGDYVMERLNRNYDYRNS